ncbi:UDP-xylose transporter 1, partial [Mucuna pruriens]
MLYIRDSKRKLHQEKCITVVFEVKEHNKASIAKPRSNEGKMGEGEKFHLGTVGALSLSVVSSVSIVICNKALMSTLHFIFATTLTSWHLLVTFCSLHVALKMRFFEHKPFEQKAVMGFGILNGISIGLLNLSLGFNSVGFYQMTNTIQKKFKVTSTQLLYQSCPYQAATLLICGPYLDKLLTNLNVFSFKYTTQVTVAIVLSCLISIAVNFSTFLVIGKTSPVTYQVLGHLKTCLVLAFGYIIVHDPFSWRNILGIMIAMVGMILYSYCCALESKQKAAEMAAQASQAREGETDTLINVDGANTILNKRPPVWSKEKD